MKIKMNIRSQKGYTGVDIAISVIVITIFISLIAVLIYKFNSSSDELEIKSKATEIAINEIEKVKAAGFEAYEEMNKMTTEDKEGNSLINQPIEEEQGFYRTILVEDYTDIAENENKLSNLVKRVTVTISYMYKGEKKEIKLSTILSKENE